MTVPTPYLSIQPRQIYQGVLHPNSSEQVRFAGFEFRTPIDLQGVTFQEGVIFSRCVFCEPVRFVGAHFRGTARFYKCVFRKPADFTWAVIEPNEKGGFGSIYNGEANFSWSRFEAPVNFYGTRFQGPVCFWRTLFRDEAKLESRFDSEVTFEANPAFVCLEASDFVNPAIFYALHETGLLSQDQDDPLCANMTAIESTLFCERLRRAGWTPEKIEQEVSVYSQWSGDMFSEHGASFQGAYFANPDGVVFRNVSLKTCRFANSNAGRAQFQNVQWDRQATFLWAGARRQCPMRGRRFQLKLFVQWESCITSCD